MLPSLRKIRDPWRSLATVRAVPEKVVAILAFMRAISPKENSIYHDLYNNFVNLLNQTP